MNPITNQYDPARNRPVLDADTVWLYRPVEGRDWSYSHHQSITFFRDRFYAIWSNGRVHEDDLGQRVFISSSADFRTWTTPEPLVDSRSGRDSDLVLTAAGFYEYSGTLVAYYGQYEYDPANVENGAARKLGVAHRDTELYALTTTDGKTWTEPVSMGIPIVPNHGPQPLASGRLIISGNISFPYTDDPSGLGGWTMGGIYPEAMRDTVVDDSEGFWTVQKAHGWATGLCEGSFYQTDDRVIHMLLRNASGRTESDRRLWVTESTDDGTTWSPPAESGFTDNNTKFHFGRLPDGSFYHVGSPDPNGRRCPLVLSLSSDGIVFDRAYILADTEHERRIEGLHKGGVYGYPHTMVHDGSLYVIVSVCKEDVMALRVPYQGL